MSLFFFFYDSFFSPLFPFHFRHVFGSLAVCPRGTQAAPPLSVALGGRGEERGGSAAGLMPAAPRPRGQPEKEAGRVWPRWDTSNPAAWLGQKGRNTGMLLSPLLCRAWYSLSPASAALGSPRGLWLLGVFRQWEDGAGAALAPLPVHSPVPGQRSSRGQAVWHPARQPSLRRGRQPRP